MVVPGRYRYMHDACHRSSQKHSQVNKELLAQVSASQIVEAPLSLLGDRSSLPNQGSQSIFIQCSGLDTAELERGSLGFILLMVSSSTFAVLGEDIANFSHLVSRI
mmetsp:Transcript_5529/g.13023  ORF Transcript_5529/g.13023 Transcript_5529/m.13023 type:complete len:106 (+) Transcript_5529:506-823(+)